MGGFRVGELIVISAGNSGKSVMNLHFLKKRHPSENSITLCMDMSKLRLEDVPDVR